MTNVASTSSPKSMPSPTGPDKADAPKVDAPKADAPKAPEPNVPELAPSSAPEGAKEGVENLGKASPAAQDRADAQAATATDAADDAGAPSPAAQDNADAGTAATVADAADDVAMPSPAAQDNADAATAEAATVAPAIVTTGAGQSSPNAVDNATADVALSDGEIIAQEAAARAGIVTANDGSAITLNDGGYGGNRDVQITTLSTEKADIERQIAENQARLDQLNPEISGKDGTAQAIQSAASAVNPVLKAADGLAGLFGKSFEPVKDAANAVQGTDELQTELEEKQAALEQQSQDIDGKIGALENETTLNFLTDVAHVTDLGDATTRVLDGNSDIALEVTDELQTGGDAEYNRDTNSIQVSKEQLQSASEQFMKLKDEGIVDANGEIVDVARFNASDIGDDAISIASLIGVHEATHAGQENSGQTDAVTEQVLAGEGTGATGLEYEAYRNQESLELQAGKEKEGFATINPDGSLLPADQAMANIDALQNGAPLPYGASAGTVLGGGGTTASVNGEDPGRRMPGRRMPGDDLPGRRMPGADLPGRRMPGEELPGRRMPGQELPGRRMPGVNFG